MTGAPSSPFAASPPLVAPSLAFAQGNFAGVGWLLHPGSSVYRGTIWTVTCNMTLYICMSLASGYVAAPVCPC